MKEVSPMLVITISSTRAVQFILEDPNPLSAPMSKDIILDLSEYAYLEDETLPLNNSEL